MNKEIYMISKLCRNTTHGLFLCILVLGRSKDNHGSRHSVSLQSHSIQDHTCIQICESKLSGKTFRFSLVTRQCFPQESKNLSNLIQNHSLLPHLYPSGQSCICFINVSQHENLITAEKNPCLMHFKISNLHFFQTQCTRSSRSTNNLRFCLPLFPNYKISVSSRNYSQRPSLTLALVLWNDILLLASFISIGVC